MIFVNLPVRDLAVARSFYEALGFGVDERFCDGTAVAVVIEENIWAMLLTRERFADFVTGEVGDPAEVTTVLTCLSAGSRQEVDDLLARALAAGGKPWQPVMDDGPMYGASFTDPDGNVWEAVWMDQAALG